MEQQNQQKTSDTTNNNKHLIIAGIAIIIVIALAIAAPHFKKHTVAPVTDTTTPVAAATDTTAKTSTADPAAAWNATLQKYNGRSVTFAADCTASPITHAQPLNTTVLLVNNSDVSHTIVFGTETYTIGARHYKTAKLTAAGTTIVSCDTVQNAANIGIQQ